MRIYNAKSAQIEMPLSNGTKLVIPGHSISGEFMPNSTIISVFMTSYRPTEIAFVVSGPFEISMLSNFAGSGEYVVSSLEEAVARFAPKADPTSTVAPTTTSEPTTTEAPTSTAAPTTTTEAPVYTTEAPIVDEEVKKPVVKKSVKKAEE